MIVELINVGRNMVNKTIRVKTDRQIVKELKKHILSPYFEVVIDDMFVGQYNIIVGGLRVVGQIRIIDPDKN